MLLRLKEILFNHDSSSANTDAFNIRKNEQDPLDLPEWRGVSSNPKDSPAAYARFETEGKTLTIKANFTFDGADAQKVSICALDANFHREKPFGANLSELEVGLLQDLVPNSKGNVLGSVQATPITLSTGETGFQSFNLEDVRIQDAGVGIHDIVWRWQYQVDGTNDWLDLAVTIHRIYTVVRVPKAPWSQEHKPSNTQLPWIEVLDKACEWAGGAMNVDEAAERIARTVNGLGPTVIHFDNCNHASSHYSDSNNFDCTAFLRRLRGEPGHGPRVNCTDCAAMVSSFSNSLGCDLEQSRMYPAEPLPAFGLRQHLRIGLPEWTNIGAFVYHEVAWEGECRENDELFDACLHVDGDDDPGTLTALLPANLRFGFIGQPGYRFRLVPLGSEGTCLPRPSLKRRRKLAPVTSPRAVAEALDAVKDVYAYDSWKSSDAPGTKHFLLDYFFGDFVLPGWRIVRQRQSGTRGRRPFIQSFWKRAQDVDDVVLRIDLCEGSVWTDARELLLTFLTDFQLPGIRLQKEQPEFGDVALAGPEPCVILFATANLAFLIRSVGRAVTPVTDIIAAIINKSLLNPPLIPPLERAFIPTRRFRFEVDEAFLGSTIRIREEPAPPSAPRQFYQFFSKAGEVLLQDESLFYRPLAVGLHTLNIVAVDERGAVPTQQLQLNVRSL